ncbi:MAG TPA: sigma-70 family RNA polymerase sigma factor [Pyrinomonadaceae bacterium]|jgi:RNA polymerase sigma factor (sigma-70 family)
MKEKKDEAEHAPNEDPEHPLNEEDKGETEPKDQANFSAAKDAEEVFDNSKRDVGQEITSYWNDPKFLALLDDKKFMDALDGTCRYFFYGFQPPSGYMFDDFKQDVIFHFVKGLAHYRSQAKLTTLLYEIVRNWCIDLSRRKRSPSVEDIMRHYEDGKEHEGAEFEGGEVEERYGETNHNRAAETEDGKILAMELMSALTCEERALFINYHLDGMTTSKIGDELGISHQAVSKRLARIQKKLKSFIEQPAISTHRTHAATNSQG